MKEITLHKNTLVILEVDTGKMPPHRIMRYLRNISKQIKRTVIHRNSVMVVAKNAMDITIVHQEE